MKIEFSLVGLKTLVGGMGHVDRNLHVRENAVALEDFSLDENVIWPAKSK